MKNVLTFVHHTCTCCADPSPLLPREDLGEGLAVCQTTGQFYRPQGNGYIPTTRLPAPPAPQKPAPSVRIDLSKTGYA